MIAALLTGLRPVFADFQYDLSAEDVYRIQSSAIVSRVSYSGTEQLSVRRDGKAVRFEAHARYVRSAGDGKIGGGDARFVSELLPSGSFENRVDDDPDFLTILNQPFAVLLDAATLHDLRDLHTAVPFSAGSPLGGDTLLHGLLRPGVAGPVSGHPSIAVRFEADGPMTGMLPGQGDAGMSGTMRMDGTAYYSPASGMLLALRATLTIDASLHQGKPAVTVPVHVIYRRSIRASRADQPAGETVKTRR